MNVPMGAAAVVGFLLMAVAVLGVMVFIIALAYLAIPAAVSRGVPALYVVSVSALTLFSVTLLAIAWVALGLSCARWLRERHRNSHTRPRLFRKEFP